MKALLLASAIALAVTPAHADPKYYQTTLWLSNVCSWNATPHATGNGSRENVARCQARTLGEIDGVLAGMKLSHGKPWICIPDGSTNIEKFLVVQKYVGDHPEALSADIGEVVAAALAQAYPCHH